VGLGRGRAERGRAGTSVRAAAAVLCKGHSVTLFGRALHVSRVGSVTDGAATRRGRRRTGPGSERGPILTTESQLRSQARRVHILVKLVCYISCSYIAVPTRYDPLYFKKLGSNSH
jgi:hypothetical protein